MRVDPVLRVVHLAKYAPSRRGGIETVTRELLASMGKIPRVELDCYCYDSATSEEQISPSTRVRRRRTTFTVGTTPVSLAMLRDYWSARRKVDIVHLHLPNPWSALLVAALPTAAAIVVSMHATSTRRTVLRRWYTAVTNRVLRRANIIVVSAASNTTAFHLDSFRHKVTVVPFGLDPARFQVCSGQKASAIDHGRGRVLFVGRLVYYKGLDTLLAAAQHVDAEFMVVGDGPCYAKLYGTVQESGLAERVHFLGGLDDAGLIDQLHACTMLVLPSSTISETFGMSVLEAMAFGKPVVVTSLGTGLDELVRTADCGLIVPPNNPDALASALNDLLGSPRERDRFGANGRRAFEQRYTSGQMAKAILEIYDTVAGPARSVNTPNEMSMT